MKNILLVLLLLFVFTPLVQSQTQVPTGNVSGKFTKAKSPYIINGHIEVPVNKLLEIEAGTELRFNGPYTLTVYGSIQALGTPIDSITFTAHDVTNRWRGLHIWKNTPTAPPNIFEFCKFTHAYQMDRDPWRDFGAMLIDTVDNLTIRNSVFSHNTSFAGAGMRIFHSKLSIIDCLFEYNLAVDSAKEHPPATDGPFASCIGSSRSNVTIINSTFRNNKTIAPNYATDKQNKAAGTATFYANKLYIEGCLFEDNYASGGSILSFSSYVTEGLRDSAIIKTCQFKRNTIRENGVVQIRGVQTKFMRCFMSDCLFTENFCPNWGSTLYTAASFGNTQIDVNRCRFLKNQTTSCISSSSSNIKLRNSLICGQEGVAFFSSQGSEPNIINSILANNWGGITGEYQSNLQVHNSIIAYNGKFDTLSPYDFGTDDLFAYSHGISVHNLAGVEIFNSIVQHNKGFQGQMANFRGAGRYQVAGRLQNTIMEGGIDSTTSQRYYYPWSRDSNYRVAYFDAPFNVYDTVVQFKNPPKGIGVAFCSDQSNFEIVETCDSSLIFNKANNFMAGKTNYDLWPDGVDYNGNQRIICGKPDIGPFESKGPISYTFLEKDWLSDTLCKNRLEEFDPHICGDSIQYTWQYSADNAVWSNLSDTSFVGSDLKTYKDGFYRIICEQKYCGNIDTFGSARLSMLSIPNPDLGPDTIIYKDQKLWLTPGTFDKYVWTVAGGDTSHVVLDPSRGNYGKKRLIWTEVTGSNGCTARDTIIVQFHYWPSGIQEIQGVEVSVFPNPSTSEVMIKTNRTNILSIAVYKSTGERVHNESFEFQQDSTSLKIGSWSPGVYLIRLQTSEGNELYARFIKHE